MDLSNEIAEPIVRPVQSVKASFNPASENVYRSSTSWMMRNHRADPPADLHCVMRLQLGSRDIGVVFLHQRVPSMDRHPIRKCLGGLLGGRLDAVWKGRVEGQVAHGARLGDGIDVGHAT